MRPLKDAAIIVNLKKKKIKTRTCVGINTALINQSFISLHIYYHLEIYSKTSRRLFVSVDGFFLTP
jgi:hypothetical protein